MNRTGARLLGIAETLGDALSALSFAPPVAYVYNPGDYARPVQELYLSRYARGEARTLLLGMNPGPWGMAQTGVPFGTVSVVRDWLGLEAKVGRPAREHPKRPVLGFACKRDEVSGQRLWGWARETYGTPERFFSQFFVANYCPLLFLEEGGRNLTPDKLSSEDRSRLLEPCDQALRGTVEVLAVDRVVGVGQFAEGRARAALETADVEIGRVLHPSPASPLANRGWGSQASRQLRALGLKIPSIDS